MGILNVTEDSFSDGGKYNTIEKAVAHAKLMEAEGADLIDIGGESTKPNFKRVDEKEELLRVIPIIEALKSEINIPISIDTYKAKVAEAALAKGASMINDVYGFKMDPAMAKVAAEYQVPCCLMHNRSNTNYKNIMNDIKLELLESINIAKAAGVKEENIILDPGIGFGKNYEQNLIVINNLGLLSALNFPVLLGCSRKSVIGNTLGLPTLERLEGTLATSVIGILKGCDFLRVHDVLENKRVAIMTDTIRKQPIFY